MQTPDSIILTAVRMTHKATHIIRRPGETIHTAEPMMHTGVANITEAVRMSHTEV